MAWLQGAVDEVKAMLVPPRAEFYDQDDAAAMDRLLAEIDSDAQELF